MARKYPRFLYSDPQDTKSKGPFIVHTLFPRMICRINHEDIEILELFDKNASDQDLDKAVVAMHKWLDGLSRKIEIEKYEHEKEFHFFTMNFIKKYYTEIVCKRPDYLEYFIIETFDEGLIDFENLSEEKIKAIKKSSDYIRWRIKTEIVTAETLTAEETNYLVNAKAYTIWNLSTSNNPLANKIRKKLGL